MAAVHQQDLGERLLGLARHWYATGAAEELRRRTGDPGPVRRRSVEDDAYTEVEEVTLGGVTVRAGHSAVLTSLEWAFGIRPPVAELVARAVPYPNALQVNRSTVSHVLVGRRSPRDWSELAALRDHPDPAHRRFLADVLGNRQSLACFQQRPDTRRDPDFLAAWALDEPDGQVLARVLDVYTSQDHPQQEAIGVRFAGHPDPEVRREVPYCLVRAGEPLSATASDTLARLARDPDTLVRRTVAQALGIPRGLTPASREMLLALVQDPVPQVRIPAAGSLGLADEHRAVVTDALAELLDEEDVLLRLEAAYALALRDDPRTEEAYERVGPLDAGFGHDPRADALRRYRTRNPAPSDPAAG
ncbi:HEAT repeat domain-containing protein [Streptomyces sp. NPDC000594]|uniref:HEAT repeat domain-containing protein n=1 Tax=Streptomyces sp. NPDC000594 TaxID=3154261 RepID=UPI003319777F